MSTNSGDEDSFLSDWVSQAEAARIQGVSRQAIHKMVQSGRLKCKSIGGHLFVSRIDLEHYRPLPSGRPKASESRNVEKVKRLISGWSPEERLELFRYLQKSVSVHPLEEKLGIPADVILEAIRRSGELTLRMIRGVIAEAAFDTYVVKNLAGWQSQPFSGDRPFDFLLAQDGFEPVKVQVKLQRSARGLPWFTDNVAKRYHFITGMFVVETQRTRGGKDPTTGELTRPYRFGEFDILAVSMYPSTKSWDAFKFTVGDWLIPKGDSRVIVETYQPIPQQANNDWADNFETCVSWLREGRKKTIGGRKETNEL